jgi:hypothetical protein
LSRQRLSGIAAFALVCLAEEPAEEFGESLGANEFKSVHRSGFVSDDSAYFSARKHFELNQVANI